MAELLFLSVGIRIHLRNFHLAFKCKTANFLVSLLFGNPSHPKHPTSEDGTDKTPDFTSIAEL